MTPKPHSNPPLSDSLPDSLSGGLHYVGPTVSRPASKFTQPIPRKTKRSPQPPTPSTPSSRFRLRWQWLAAGIVVTSSILGFGATALLLKLPAVPNCPEMFLPTTSASVRLYCAQLAANKGTTADLLEAVHLVQELPNDHPLYPEIERYLVQWVDQLLDLAEETFQDGELEEALRLANELSGYVDPEIITQRTEEWQAIWDEAEEIVAEIQGHREQGAWGQAFQAAGKLTKLDNRYWSTTRYDEIFEELNLAQKESRKLDDAFAKLRRGGLENLLAAIAAAEKVAPDSPAHPDAKTLIHEAKIKLIDLAVRSLKSGDWQSAMQVVNRVPARLNLQDELADLTLLADAASVASFGTQINLEDAIIQAQKVEPGRPLYSHAQTLIDQWQRSITAGLNLEAAITLARDGSEQGLNAAITQARTISASNPRYQEAQRRIRDWQAELQRRRDRPTLDEAENVVQVGDSRREIIPAAQQPVVGSPQVSEQDQSLLNQANALASQGRYTEAIQAAQQIGSDSPLYSEAQGQIAQWQAAGQSQNLITQADQQAQTGTPEALSRAIQLVGQINRSGPQGGRVQERINAYSSQLLAIARSRARNNLVEAIRVARLIPSGSTVYSTAQAQISNWERLLNSGAGQP